MSAIIITICTKFSIKNYINYGVGYNYDYDDCNAYLLIAYKDHLHISMEKSIVYQLPLYSIY